MTVVEWQWTGDDMHPLPRFHGVVNEEFVVGERYRLEVVEERSANSHSHYFARLNEIWLNLPEHSAVEFATSEHLRKRALIMTGHRDERRLVASSKAEALRFAAFLRPRDDYVLISVAENVVLEWTATSQSKRAMGAKEFQISKQNVLDWCDDLIGISQAPTASAGTSV